MAWLLIPVIALLIGYSTPIPAEATEMDRTRVDHHQRVEDFFLFGGDGTISGEVGEAVVIMGDLTLTKTARVRDHVFVIGGRLRLEPGAQIDEGIVHIDAGERTLNSLVLGLGTFAGLELGKLALDVIIIVFCLLYFLLARKQVMAAKQILQDNFVKTGTLGLFASLGLVLILAALSITIIGIPVAAFLMLVVLLLLPVGLAALSLIFGEIVLTGTMPDQNPLLQTLAGALILVAFLSFPVLGLVWGGLVFIMSLGATASIIISHRSSPGDAR
jgi:hypothetical protein